VAGGDADQVRQTAETIAEVVRQAATLA